MFIIILWLLLHTRHNYRKESKKKKLWYIAKIEKESVNEKERKTKESERARQERHPLSRLD
jgi:hypothetical protein